MVIYTGNLTLPLRIGIIGAGSVAQLVAESLVRTGFMHVDIIDFDLVEEHNLDRLLHATEDDIGKPKVHVLVDTLRNHTVTPGAAVHGFDDSVTEQKGWLRALDCDVLFSCVDRPWPRFALNVAAYAHLIPVVDGGVAVDVHVNKNATSSEAPRLVGAEWRAHLVGPHRKCMECLGQYEPGDVGMERAGLLDDPTYIRALPVDHHLRGGENVFAFSMACAAAEVLELLRAVLGPSRRHDVGATLTHWTTSWVSLFNPNPESWRRCGRPSCGSARGSSRSSRSGTTEAMMLMHSIRSTRNDNSPQI